MHAALFITALAVAIFCAGVAVPVVGAYMYRTVRNMPGAVRNILVVLARYAPCLAGFGAGVAITLLFFLPTNPYTVARWVGAYDEAMIGVAVLADPEALEAGRLPQAVLERYSSREE